MIIQRGVSEDRSISYCYRYVDYDFRSYINEDFRLQFDSIEDILEYNHKIITEFV